MPEPMIPAHVLDRLSVEEREKVIRRCVTRDGVIDVETRAYGQALKRDDTGDTWALRGYATSYGYGYDIAGGPEAGGWTEIVDRGAANKTIRDGGDVVLVHNHGGIPLASVKGGTLTLRSDDLGVRYDAPNLDQSSPYVRSIWSAVERRDLDSCSLAMRVIGQTWSDDYTVRHITEMALYDVSIVNSPANPATVVIARGAETPGGIARADLRSLFALIEKRAEDEGAEAAVVSQIKSLVAGLIQGEAQDIIDGGEAIGSLRALVSILSDLDWYQSICAYEDSVERAASPVSLEYALATATALRSHAAV